MAISIFQLVHNVSTPRGLSQGPWSRTPTPSACSSRRQQSPPFSLREGCSRAKLAGMTDRIRIIKHEAVPDCGSFEVWFPDGRASEVDAAAHLRRYLCQRGHDSRALQAYLGCRNISIQCATPSCPPSFQGLLTLKSYEHSDPSFPVVALCRVGRLLF